MRNWEKSLLFEVSKSVYSPITANASCIPVWGIRFWGVVHSFLITLPFRTNLRDIIGKHWCGWWAVLDYALKWKQITKLLVTFVMLGWWAPLKTMSGSKYYGGIAYGCNVFLCCHTDADFTMSISQVFLKGRNRYEIDNEVVVYCRFLTLGVAVPLWPGDFLMFNSLIPTLYHLDAN